MTAESSVYVLDSFAMLAFFQGEPAGARVRDLLTAAARSDVRLLMSVINLGEVIYKTIQRYGSDRADDILGLLLTEYPVTFVDADQELVLRAAAIKGRHPMSYADCVAAALAQREDAVLVTGDPEFRHVEGQVAIEWLASDR